jgi:hypothetical protein
MKDNDASGVKESLTAQEVLDSKGVLENGMISGVMVKSDHVFNIANADTNPIVEFKNNGDIYVKGRLVTNDMEVIEGIREWLRVSKFIPYKA